MTRPIKTDTTLVIFDVVTNFTTPWICDQNGDPIAPEPSANAIEVWLKDYTTPGDIGTDLDTEFGLKESPPANNSTIVNYYLKPPNKKKNSYNSLFSLTKIMIIII